MENKILSIPKHILKFDNGYTLCHSNLYFKFNRHFLYREIKEDYRLFYRVLPYLIVQYNNRYLVYNSNGCYCFNPGNLYCIKKMNTFMNPIELMLKINANKYIGSSKGITSIGVIKAINSRPNDIAFVYNMKLDKKIDGIWLTLNELIDKNRLFDDFGMQYINYLVEQKIKRR